MANVAVEQAAYISNCDNSTNGNNLRIREGSFYETNRCSKQEELNRNNSGVCVWDYIYMVKLYSTPFTHVAVYKLSLIHI